MELEIRRRREARGGGGGRALPGGAEALLERYPHDLQLYARPPAEDVTLAEFERLALERVRALRALAAASTLQGHRPHSGAWGESVAGALRAACAPYARLCERSAAGGGEREARARRDDHVAHYILRLAYCRTDDLRRWFVARELELFKIRFAVLRPDAVDSFFAVNGLDYRDISPDEKAEIVGSLRESTPQRKTDGLRFYKVRFHEVLDLVRSRKVFLRNGFAYVPHSDLVSVLASQFRRRLMRSLSVASQHLGEIEQDERLVGLLKGLHTSYTGEDYMGEKAAVPIETLDALSLKSFPLCMRQLHENLRSAHHLKHGGRLQYGLFLKGIGVTLEDSLRFWREEFTKIMDLDKFEKQYAYNVRYNYGKEGSKRNYSPYSCMKVIESSVGPGDCHGCPFRHCDATNLKNKLQGYGVSSQGIAAVMDMAKKGHYQIACSKYFDATHNLELGLGINHPNQYFEESQNLIQGNTKVQSSQRNEYKKSYVKKENNDLDEMDFDIEMAEVED